MLEQTGGFRRDLPIAWIRQASPLVHMRTEFIDDRSGVVQLLLSRKPLAFIENHSQLLSDRVLALPGLRNGRDELGLAAFFNDLLCRLTLIIKLPVP